ncbi:hypothetical protein F0562_026082 [Nyssa sinensis]|uniref:Uncharacterized protein n=1 Tax=Nyssa sinensis TaxID=561372 RepID=A0A5J5BA99_9ASTE|nr:hypothetical protein F0562_026082 [Nyssa sinensis]
MPVSGNKEPGVIARQSSSCSAGIPIKKRRFPLVWSPSPLPQEPSTVPAENDSLQKEQSNPSQESSLSNATAATNSPSFSDANKNSFSEERKDGLADILSEEKKEGLADILSEEKKEGLADTDINSVQNNVNVSRVKLEEPRPTISSGSMYCMENKEKLVLTQKFSHQKIKGNTELYLAPNEALSLNEEKEILSKQKVEGDCKLELSNLPSDIKLSLGLKEHHVPVFAGQNSEGSCQVPEKLDPSTLCLSLGKEKYISQCGSNDVKSNHDGANLHANRSNWDLNTTMDAWEGSVGSAAADQGTVGFDGLNQTSGAHDIKPSICLNGMVGVSVDSGKQIPGRGENKSDFPISSLTPSQIYKSEDSLHLRLSMSSLHTNFRGEHSGSSAEVDSGRVVRNSNLLGMLVSSGKVNAVGCKTVKLEPLDGDAKHDFVGAKGSPMGLVDSTAKHQFPEKYGFQPVKLSTSCPQKLVENRTIKSEPVQEGNQETHKTTEGTSHQSDEKIVQCHDNQSLTMPMPLSPQKLYPSGLHDCSTELSISGDVPNQSEHSIYTTKEVNINMDTPQETSVSLNQVASETVSLSVGFEGKESNVCDGRIDTSQEEDLNSDDPETCRLKMMDELPLNSRGNGEGSVSDEEKINISADILEEEFYGSDYESDGNHALVVPMDTEDRRYDGEDDEYEDGEVREPQVHAAVEDPIGERREAENFNLGDCEKKNVDSFGLPADGIAQSCVEEKDSKRDDHGETSDDHIKVCVDKVCFEIADKGVDKDGSLQEPLTIEVVAGEADEKRPIKATRRGPLDQLGKKEVQQGHETEVSFDGANNGSQGTVAAVGQVADGNIKGTDREGENDSTLSKSETSLNGDDATKDAYSGGNRSRIINLPRASNVTSPCKTRYISGRSLQSQTGRERYIDFEGDKLYPRGNRDEIYVDGPRKFIRERFQDQSFRNSRLNFVRGRGRVSSRLDTLHSDWETDRAFAPDIYNGAADYQFPRHKRASAVADAEHECDGYIIAPRGAIGTGRGARKPLSDELCSFDHPSARRRSPRGRDGPATRGIQLVHRIPRNISPSRCTGEVGSDLVGLRPGEKFMRGLPDDVIDPVFTRPQPPFEGVDGQFVRGNRNFSSVQRRGLPRIQSKSPIRYRTRSPGRWTSPQRRSPGGFNGLPELTHRRSPPIYRIERMRSPDLPCFPEEMVARRHGSPPYMSRPSNDSRDMDCGRDQDHPRSIIPNRRSPSDRILPRSTRRFDILDPRERTDHDEYFGAPMHPGRFHELGGDGGGDERRKCGERRGPFRSFRPPYNGAENENFRFHIADGPRPFRFCPEADSEFLERSNLREREFDRRIKNRHVNGPRRTRRIEEQEENYRHGGQVWHDDDLDDISRVKRRRF